MSICCRQGLGKLRHVDTRRLWVQQRVRDRSLELRTVRGEVNPADLFTKHLSSEERVTELLKLFGCRMIGGRAESAPELRRPEGEDNEGLLDMEIEDQDIGPNHILQDGCAYESVTADGVCVPDARRHDIRSLPHQQSGDLNLLFPRAVAADELPETEEQLDRFEARGMVIGRRSREIKT